MHISGRELGGVGAYCDGGRTWTNSCRLRVGVLILCGVRLWMRESVVRCWDIQCSGKEAECGERGQRGVGEGRLLGGV